MADARKPCRCTLLESGQADMAKLVRDYVDSISADEKTDEATYTARREETAGVSGCAGKVGRGGSGIA